MMNNQLSKISSQNPLNRYFISPKLKLDYLSCLDRFWRLYISIYVMDIQSNLSTTVRHGELQKWPLMTGGCCLGTYTYSIKW